METRTAAELGVFPPQAFWECVLVREMEYTQDRLRHEIALLKSQLEEMEREWDKQRTATMVAEILLCMFAFIAGYITAHFF